MKYSVVLVLVLACVACKPKEKVEPFNTEEVFVAIDENLITYRADDFYQKCLALQTNCDSYINNEIGIDQLLQSWKKVLSAWSYLELYNMYSIQDNFIQNRIAKAPVNTNFVEAYIADTSLVINNDFISTIGSTSKGLFCIEYLLFENETALIDNQQRRNFLPLTHQASVSSPNGKESP